MGTGRARGSISPDYVFDNAAEQAGTRFRALSEIFDPGTIRFLSERGIEDSRFDALRNRVPGVLVQCCHHLSDNKTRRAGVPDRERRQTVGVDVLRTLHEFGKGR